MKTVKIKKSELLEVIENNRRNHRRIFLKAIEGYRKKVIELLEEAIKDAKSGCSIQTHFSVIEPIDQTEDYDRVIRMLEMSIDDVVELTEQEFAQYVMDQWTWSSQFAETAAFYVG